MERSSGDHAVNHVRRDAILRDAVHRAPRRCVKAVGDAFQIAFPTAITALTVACGSVRARSLEKANALATAFSTGAVVAVNRGGVDHAGVIINESGG